MCEFGSSLFHSLDICTRSFENPLFFYISRTIVSSFVLVEIKQGKGDYGSATTI